MRLTCFLVCLAVIVIVACPAAAVDKFRVFGFNDNWNSDSGWSPVGIPTTNDRVFIDTGLTVRLSANSAAVDDLFISNGSDVRTNGFRLTVSEFLGVSDTEITGTGSSIRVAPTVIPGSAAFDTDVLIIASGGLLDMAGGDAEIDTQLDITSDSTLAGDGLVTIQGSGLNKLSNAGTIRAEGGTLTLRSVGGGTFDLDGLVTPTTGVLEAIDGSATLIIDGDLGNDAFSSMMNIGAGNTIRFDQEWATNAGAINFDAAGGVATLDGAQLTHGGTMNVNSGTARVSAPVTFDLVSTVNVAAGATLDLGPGPTSVRGTIALTGGATSASAAVIDGTLLSFSSANFVIDQTAQLDADSRVQLSSTFSLPGAEDVLRLANETIVFAGATFTGLGQLVVLDGASLIPTNNTDFDVRVENRGTLNPSSDIFTGGVDVEAYEQTSTGVLEIDVANVTPGNFDVLTVQGNAVLGGTLDVNLINGFEPLLGNTFTVMETVFGVVGGTFDNATAPTFNGLTFGVVYHSQSVVLEVVEHNFILGDADGDGDVDLTDFNVLAANFGLGPGAPGGFSIGDFNEDGDVNLQDFNLLAANFGIGTETVNPLPEPGTLALLLAPLAAGRLTRARAG